MTDPTSRERADILEVLAKHRGFLRQTVEGMSEEQIRARSTVSELCLGAIVKHVAAVEEQWCSFMALGAEAFADSSPEKYAAEWRVEPTDTVDSLLAAYAEVAARTDAAVAEVDLDSDHPLPPAPWFEPGASGRPGGSRCTSSPRRPSTPATPTSCGRRSTARRRWAERRARARVGHRHDRPRPPRPHVLRRPGPGRLPGAAPGRAGRP